jgi:hypothetical protein
MPKPAASREHVIGREQAVDGDVARIRGDGGAERRVKEGAAREMQVQKV